MLSSFLLTSALSILTSAHPKPHPHQANCPPFADDFTIKRYQFYPKNADFDFNTCKLYLGQLWNASLGIYDPYTSKHEIVEFDGISHNSAFHMGAVGANRRTGLLSIIADAANAFPSEGRDISGTNWLLQYDPMAKNLVYKINLTESSQGRYGGFQDVEQDPEGNVFVVGTWPRTITKVSADGREVTPWYLPEEIIPTNKAFGGIAALDWLLLAQGDRPGIVKFDLRASKGVPAQVKIVGTHTFGVSDAISLPPKYHGTVLLVAEEGAGFSVFESKDAKWDVATFKGFVENTSTQNGTSVTAVVQIGDGLFEVLEPFGDAGVNGPGSAGVRADFLFKDVTADIEVLLK